MYQRKPTPDNETPGAGAPPKTAPRQAPASSADLIPRRQLEKSLSWSGRERLRCLWYRLRLTVAEMNYATRRTVELQAPWITEEPQPGP